MVSVDMVGYCVLDGQLRVRKGVMSEFCMCYVTAVVPLTNG